jgi:hypothetical protein
MSELFVRTIEGNIISIPFLNDMTVKQVKIRLKAKTGTELQNIVLVSDGRELQNNNLLEDYKISKGSVV